MAFVNRAERKLLLYSTSNSVGPGAYIGISKYKSTSNYAPFSSSTERQIEKPIPAYTPGPGSYVEVFQRGRALSNNSSPFASNKARFDNKFENVPGPGSYNITPRWAEKKPISKSVNSTNWIRLPSAPSIPGPSQGYGYDETSNGELLLHKGPTVISGTSKDSVGPGHYNPQKIIPQKAVAWHKSNSKRTTFLNKSSAPGPGAYAPGNILPKYKQKPNAVFISSSKRHTEFVDEDNDSDGVPGPGKYSVKSTFTPSPPRQNTQNFGSGVERFKTTTPEQLQLGPGWYDLPSPNFKQRPFDSKAPFCSTNLRFQTNIDLNPGPGAYKQVDIQKKVWGKQGVFGCTEKRFMNKSPEEIPGPGTYALEGKIGIHNSSKHKGHSVFLSKCKRLEENNTHSAAPAPGSYDIPSTIGVVKPPPAPIHPILVREDQVPKSVGFNAQADRFFNNNSEVPGPGTYKIQDNKANKTVIVSKDSRFKEINKVTIAPGPGTYAELPNWNKRTFNVLFE